MGCIKRVVTDQQDRQIKEKGEQRLPEAGRRENGELLFNSTEFLFGMMESPK